MISYIVGTYTCRHTCSAHILTIASLLKLKLKRMKSFTQRSEIISAHVGQKCLWSGMTNTHVLMWEQLEDELLFNLVLIGKAVIALCFFQSAIAYRCCCRVWNGRQTLVFQGVEKKNKQSMQCLSEVYPSPLPPCLHSLGSLYTPPTILSFGAAALLCLHYSRPLYHTCL